MTTWAYAWTVHWQDLKWTSWKIQGPLKSKCKVWSLIFLSYCVHNVSDMRNDLHTKWYKILAKPETREVTETIDTNKLTDLRTNLSDSNNYRKARLSIKPEIKRSIKISKMHISRLGLLSSAEHFQTANKVEWSETEQGGILLKPQLPNPCWALLQTLQQLCPSGALAGMATMCKILQSAHRRYCSIRSFFILFFKPPN